MSKLTSHSVSPAASIEVYDYLRRLFDKDGITDTAMFLSTVSGLGGFAAQQAVWKTCIEPNNRDVGDFLWGAGTKSGETLYFGESINLFLCALREGTFSFYSLISGSLLVGENHPLLDLHEIFRHVTQSVGSNNWNVRVPSPLPPLPSIRVALNSHWMGVQEILLRYDNPASEWPVILGFVAARMAKVPAEDVGSELVARIVMEGAIIACHANPSTVPGATSGLYPRWPGKSFRALNRETQKEVMNEVYSYLPKRIPG